MDQKAFTIIELLVVLVTLIILVGVVFNIYTIGLNLWTEGYTRNDIKTDLAQALELVSKNLRQAKSIDSLTESSITFTADLGGGDDTYRVYLYNPSDPEPNPPYTQESYDLRWVQGDVSYGLGAKLVLDIPQPTNALFVQTGNTITIDLTAARDQQSVSLRSKVRPRNL